MGDDWPWDILPKQTLPITLYAKTDESGAWKFKHATDKYWHFANDDMQAFIVESVVAGRYEDGPEASLRIFTE